MFSTTATLPRIRMFWRQVAGNNPIPKVPDTTPVVLTIAEVCVALRVSKWSVYQLIRARKLATIKIGSRRVVPLSAVHELIGRLRHEENS